MRFINKLLFSLVCVCSLTVPFSDLMASTLVLSSPDELVHTSHSPSLRETSSIDQDLAHRLYDIAKSLLSRLGDDYALNENFLELLSDNQHLGDFSDWMTSPHRTVSKEEKIQKTKNVLANIQHNYQAVQQYEDWIIGYSEGAHNAEQLFETLMNIYLFKSKDKVQGLSQGQSIPPTLGKHISSLDQYSQGLAQQSIDTHTLLYLLLQTLYDRIEVTNISPQSQTLLKHMPVLTSLLEGRNTVGPNPDLSLLDGAILLSGEHTSLKNMPSKVTFRSLRDDFKGSFSILKTVAERQVISKGRSKISLYKMADFLPTYENIRVITPQLTGHKQTSKAKKTSTKKKKKNKQKRKQERNQHSQKAASKASVIETTLDSTGLSPSHEKEEINDQVKDLPAVLPTLVSPSSDEDTLSTSTDISDDFEVEELDQENSELRESILSIALPVEKKSVPDLRPTLHLKRWNLLSDFWGSDKFSYRNFITLFEGFGGKIKQTKGGSSHVKLDFMTESGLHLISGTWRPHPKPVLRNYSLNHLRGYFEQCGFMLENYQMAN